jgi:hypothetical protein
LSGAPAAVVDAGVGADADHDVVVVVDHDGELESLRRRMNSRMARL